MPTKKKPAKKSAKKPAKKAAKKSAKKAAPKKAAKKAAPKKKAVKREQKTQPTTVSVSGFLDGVDAARRDDVKALTEMMERVTGESARMWGSAIVGCGNVHYKYESGHEGDTALVGFSPRKSALTVYLWGDVFGEPLMQQLGKFKTGKGCLYVKSLQDVDVSVLEKLMATSVMKVRSRFADPVR